MSAARLLAVARRETLELVRDRFRLTTAIVAPVLLMLVFGFGLTIDVEHLPYAVLDRDASAASRAYLEPFAHSRYFEPHGALGSGAELERALVRGSLAFAIEIPPGFEHDLATGRTPAVAFWIDGTMPFRADVARGYVEAMHHAWVAEHETAAGPPAPRVETRFWYNQGLRSALAFVPGLIAALLVILPSVLTAVAVVREKELGSIANLYASPLNRIEFLLGKQIPYAVLSLGYGAVLCVLALLVFDVPFRGSGAALLAGTVLYAFASTGLGLLVSCFTRTQIAAIMITILLTLLPAFLYSGFFTPVSSLSAGARAIAVGFPTTYFLDVCVGTFTKGLGFATLWRDHAALAVFAVALDAGAVALLREQEA